MTDVCVHCGWPAITRGLCLLHLEHALDAYDRLMTVLDTDSNLADSLVRTAWVAEVRARMADAARRRGQLAEGVAV